jgi:AcrR family transcriptional regulator
VRLRDIASEAGVSIGLLQHYFDKREVLLARAFEQASFGLLERYRSATELDSDPWHRIVALVDAVTLADDLEEHCAIWTELFSASRAHDGLRASLEKIYAAWQELLGSAIADGIVEGVFHPLIPPGDVLNLLLTSIDGFEVALTSGVAPATAQEMRGTLLRATASLLGLDREVDGGRGAGVA